MNSKFEKWQKAPEENVDIILDTDTFNELDDQFAIAYLLHYTDRINLKGFTVAPFENKKLVKTISEGQEKSKREIEKILRLANRTEYVDKIYTGAVNFMKDESNPVESEAARFIVEESKNYNAERRLYVVGIGAITNIASAILLDPSVTDRIVVVWLGGASHGWWINCEYNMYQDYAAVRVVFQSTVPLVQIPAHGVLMNFCTTKYELIHWLQGKNELADYLCKNAIRVAEENSAYGAWSRVIWDVAAIAFLVSNGKNFMYGKVVKRRLPAYRGDCYEESLESEMFCIQQVDRDPLMTDLFEKLSQK